jgi:hypothetical protein
LNGHPVISPSSELGPARHPDSHSTNASNFSEQIMQNNNENDDNKTRYTFKHSKHVLITLNNIPPYPSAIPTERKESPTDPKYRLKYHGDPGSIGGFDLASLSPSERQ